VAAVGVAATAAVTASALVVSTPTPAAAEPVGDCSTTVGVIVVVDFAHFGGEVVRGCGADPSAGSTTGLQAMHTAGFATDGTADYGTRFICRIVDPGTGVADPPTTPCTSTPPASAYWSYWHADPGQTAWTLSQLGVATYRPLPGSVTLWLFGGTSVTGGSGTGRPPATLTPTEVRATTVSSPAGGTTTTAGPSSPDATAPSSQGTPGGGVAATSPSSAGAGGSSASAGAGRSSPAGSGGGGSSPTTTPPVANDATTTTGPGAGRRGEASTAAGGRRGGGGAGPTEDHRARAGPKIVNVTQGRKARAGPASGSPLPFVTGALAVVALAAGGGVTTWRRRRAGGVR
jgi:hypothetical protein